MQQISVSEPREEWDMADIGLGSWSYDDPSCGGGGQEDGLGRTGSMSRVYIGAGRDRSS